MSGTKIKPQRIEANNSPQVGYVPKYVDEQTFEWGAGGSGATDIGNNYLILTGTMAGTPPEVDIADTRITDTTPYLVFYETEPVGNITRTLTNGNLHIESDDNADTLDVKVVFMGIGPARQFMKGVFAFTGTTHQILDPRIIASSAVVAMPRPTPVGYITGSTDVGEINFVSTGTEVGVLVDYVVFNDGVAFSDGMAYNPTLDDDDIMFRKNSVSGADEAFKVSDLKNAVVGGGVLSKFGGDGSDGVVDGTSDITLTGSNNTLIIKNYSSWSAGTAQRILTQANSGCNFLIKIKGDADFSNRTIDFKGGNGGDGYSPGPISGNSASFFQFYKTTGGSGGGGTGAGGGGGGGFMQNGFASFGNAGGVKPNWLTLDFILTSRQYLGCCGGGGAGSTPYNTYYGNGGGGGGFVIFEIGGNVTFNANTTATVAGGNGGISSTGVGGGGGGGGGGCFILLYNGTKTGTLVPVVAGGLGHAAGANGNEGGNGGYGAFLIEKNITF